MKLKYSFVINQIGDEFVAIPAGAEVIDFSGLLKLNEAAAFIVEALNRDTTREELIAASVEKFSCPVADAEESIDNIVNGLRDAGLITE